MGRGDTVLSVVENLQRRFPLESCSRASSGRRNLVLKGMEAAGGVRSAERETSFCFGSLSD